MLPAWPVPAQCLSGRSPGPPPLPEAAPGTCGKQSGSGALAIGSRLLGASWQGWDSVKEVQTSHLQASFSHLQASFLQSSVLAVMRDAHCGACPACSVKKGGEGPRHQTVRGEKSLVFLQAPAVE